ncbi:lyso-ornithine lipid acyltransferase [Streptosporangium subroseum]|uniref:Lyso-ornithine lipid acyltransferase n=1 Tax=Streptosporangium subroseum TaxID=106412 RepID=A0A239MAX6_9ACTN|nr:lysophospholipid acyltransferase family protein [Streptosporangium subroseum]SNT39134.1 lyso-ornithine lipid acyltransferase [Streptosporangium subroseum]
MSPWLPVSPCTPRSCITPPAASAGIRLRLSRYLAALGLVTVAVVLSVVARLLRSPLRARLARAWTKVAVRALGIRRTVSASDTATHGALVVANHISWVDPLVLAAWRPCRMVSEIEVSTWPVIGAVVASSGTIFHDRDNLRLLPVTIEKVTQALRQGDTVVVFPEATTLCGGEIGRFHPAFFQAAIDAGVPVRPLALRYRAGGRMATDPAYLGEDTMANSMRRIVRSSGVVAEVIELPEIATGDLPGSRYDRRVLAGLAWAAVSGALRPDTVAPAVQYPKERCPVSDNALVTAS